MIIDQKSFCAAPWFQIRNDQDRRYRPCCQLRPELSEFTGNRDLRWPDVVPIQWIQSDYANYLRNQIGQGQRLPECQQCWISESTGLPSLRQAINNTVTNGRGDVLEQTWIAGFAKRPANQQKNLIVSCDIKINNLCNYSCLMCNAEDSTRILAKWHRDRNIPIIQKRIQDRPGTLDRGLNLANDTRGYDLLKHSIDLLPQHLKILGGEPLIDQQLLEILESVDTEKKRAIKLLFVTNGSVDLLRTRQRLNDWKDVLFVISLEGTKKVQDYVRQGSVWSHTENNIKNYLAQTDSKLYVNFCLQSLTLAHMPDLLGFAQALSMPVDTSTVDEPEYLSLSAVPDALKPGIIQKLEKSKTDLDPEYCHLVDASLALLEQHRWKPALTEEKTQYLNWYDPDRRWQEIFPEWIPYLR